jgi:hypothetical protein
MVSKPKFVFSPDSLVNEVSSIQGDKTWISYTMINSAVEKHPEKFPIISQILKVYSKRAAKQQLTKTLQQNGYVREGSVYTVSLYRRVDE